MPRPVVDIATFDLATANDVDLSQYYRLHVEHRKVDFPEDPLPTLEAAVGRLRVPLEGFGRCEFWVASREGVMVAMAIVGFPDDPNAHLANVDVVVHPGHRRNGIATVLLGAALPRIRELGRHTVSGSGFREGGVGDAWTRALGFQVGQRFAIHLLDVSTTDRQLWDIRTPNGYRLAQWAGAAPEHLVESFARARLAIHDAPQGDMTHRFPEWTAQRVRETEAALRRDGVKNWVVAAVHEDSGDIVALTEVYIYPHRPEFAYQQDTAVLTAHRGHGLGATVKSALMRTLTAHPELERVYTGNATDNLHMIRVNQSIGFTHVRTMMWVEADVDVLGATVAGKLDQHRRDLR